VPLICDAAETEHGCVHGRSSVAQPGRLAPKSDVFSYQFGYRLAPETAQKLSDVSPVHSVRDRGVGGSNPLAPTNSDQQNRPSVDGHRRLKAIFVGDSKIQVSESC
jgi:hypothetical protein